MQHSVLLVDDDAKLVTLLKTYFEKAGFITYTALNGLEALQVVREQKPQFMESHGGTVAVRSALQQGTTVSVWLPIDSDWKKLV